MSNRPNYRSDFPGAHHSSMTIDHVEAIDLFGRPVPQIAIEGHPYEITAVLIKKEWRSKDSTFVMRGEMQLKPWENENG